MIYFPGQTTVASAIAIAAGSGFLLLVPDWWPLVLILWVVLVGVALWDYARLKEHALCLSARLKVPNACQRGETIRAELEIENSQNAVQRIRVRPLLPDQGSPLTWTESLTLEPKKKAKLLCPVYANVRGEYLFGDVILRVTTPLQMVQAQLVKSSKKVTKVLPDIKSVHDYLYSRRANILTAPHIRTANLRGIGSEFESLRDYEEGDDIRRIDWRASAKHRKLITREYEIEPFRNVIIVLDRGRLMAARVGEATKFDLAMDAALMIAGVVLDSGDRCGMMVFDRDVQLYIAPKSSLSHLPTIVDSLYDLQPVLDESHFQRAFILLQKRLLKRSLVIVLSNMVDVDASGSMLKGMATLSKRHLVLLAAIRTPEVQEVINRSLSEPLDSFRKAVAYRLVKERNEVIQRLRSSGVYILDVQPDELTLPLVNKYIELRERNLL